MIARHDLAPPPRQLAVGDPGFNRIGPRVRIFLNGEEIKRCTAYDLDQQFVICHRLNERGHIFVDPGTDEVATERLTGKVEVKWR